MAHTKSGIFLPSLPERGPRPFGRRASLTMGIGAVLNADGSVHWQDEEWQINALHDAGEQEVLQVFFSEQAHKTKFLGLLNSAYTVLASTNVFTTSVAHGLVVGDTVTFGPITSGTAGITAGTVYFILTAPTTTSFTVSATSGGAVIDVTTDGSGGWMSEKLGTMTAVAETTTPTTNGYDRRSVLAGDWANDGLIPVVTGDYRFSAAEKTFGPATATLTCTHASLSTTLTGAGLLFLTLPLSAVTAIAPTQSFKYILRAQVS